MLSIGNADVEMCQSGVPLKEFPSILSIQRINNSRPQQRHSVDIEMSLASTFSPSRQVKIASLQKAASEAQKQSQSASKNTLGESQKSSESQSGGFGTPFLCDDSVRELSDCLAYISGGASSNGNVRSNNKSDLMMKAKSEASVHLKGSFEKENKIVKRERGCLLVICPSYWTYKKVRTKHDVILAVFLGHD